MSGILRPIVEKCPTFVKDTTHRLNKLNDFQFTCPSEDNLLFTMDVKGLFTNIPNEEGLKALKFFLEKEELQVPIDCILRLSELMLTLNCFEFNGEFYTQVSGTMMGSPFSVNYSCLALSDQEELLFGTYSGDKPLMYLIYIDDIFGVSSMSRNHLDQFVNFLGNFSPALKYTSYIG